MRFSRSERRVERSGSGELALDVSASFRGLTLRYRSRRTVYRRGAADLSQTRK